jgi:hypothetical protein
MLTTQLFTRRSDDVSIIAAMGGSALISRSIAQRRQERLAQIQEYRSQQNLCYCSEDCKMSVFHRPNQHCQHCLEEVFKK